MNLRTDSLAAQAALLNELLTACAVPEMRATGISASVFELLSTISAGNGKDTQVEVARKMGITESSIVEGLTEDELSMTLAVLKRLNRELAVSLQKSGNL